MLSTYAKQRVLSLNEQDCKSPTITLCYFVTNVSTHKLAYYNRNTSKNKTLTFLRSTVAT